MGAIAPKMFSSNGVIRDAEHSNYLNVIKRIV